MQYFLFFINGEIGDSALVVSQLQQSGTVRNSQPTVICAPGRLSRADDPIRRDSSLDAEDGATYFHRQ